MPDIKDILLHKNVMSDEVVRYVYGYLIYLRKSRQDDPNETVEEVLSKHETILQEHALRELGGLIPEENIYREVVSGESIESRVEIKKVLARIEDPDIKGVLVVEPSRLSRGDLKDCGRLVDAFRYTHTLVVTQMMTYDLEKKHERKFFQDELLRGNEFLEYTKEILWRGRVAAAKRGCFIGKTPPYGYDKVKIGKDHTLEPNEDAVVVQSIFDLYTRERLTPGRIAMRLNDIAVPSPSGDGWKKDTIRYILRNPHYIGKIRFNYIKDTNVLDNGEIVRKRIMQPEEEVIIAEGKHSAIISMETWIKAQELIDRHPRVKFTYDLKNPYAGLLFCSKCGRAMSIHPYKHAEDRFECKTKPRCYKSTKQSELEDAILFALENAELPKLELKVKNGDGDAAKIQQKLLTKLEAQMEEYRDQEEKQYELLETRKYTQELFDRRNAALREKMEACQKQIYQAKASLPKNVDYAEKVVFLQDAIKSLKDPDATPAEKNRRLTAIVERIEFTGSPAITERKGKPRGDNPFSIQIFLRL